ncbi:MAG: nucleoside hydrolase [Gammaproteobacteria bacterium]|nr:nucleoside hydrolase [Gammaproteobacteria bacterium]
MKHKVILDTDPGVDDTMAIAYALCHPDIELLALTTVFGNTNVEQTTLNAQYVLNLFGAMEVEVAKGASKPCVQAPRDTAESVHGADGLGNCFPKNGQLLLHAGAAHASLATASAAEYIVQMARQNPAEITLVAVGPLTNLRDALAIEPDLPDLLKEVIVMGGTVLEPGNVSPVAEANFLSDPHAADQIMAADWPLTVVGLDVTHKILIGNQQLSQLCDEAGVIGEFIWQSSRFYVDFYASRRGAAYDDQPACAMHDAAAIAYLLMPDAFEVHTGAARVVDEGIAVGQFVLDTKGYDYALTHWKERHNNVSACMRADSERVLADFLSTLINSA